jgi:hypothetical protein
MRMEYRVKRTYVELTAGESTMRRDRRAHRVSAESARSAALDFISGDHARLLGALKELPSGEVTGTAWRDGRVYVIFVDPWEEQGDAESHG